MKNKISNFLTTAVQGFFWLIPIVAIVVVFVIVFDKLSLINSLIADFLGMSTDKSSFLFVFIAFFGVVILCYLSGKILNTFLGEWFNTLIHKVPFYKNLADFFALFNSAKSGEQDILVVAIKGFGNSGYNIGLMYNTNESLIKGYYSVVLSHMPLQGGFIFEVKGEDIYVIKEAKFNHNLEYLLTSASRSMADILKVEPKSIDEFPNLIEYKKTSKILKSNLD
jgi:uncharacterized membrane protein